MNRIDPKRAAIFVGVFCIIALTAHALLDLSRAPRREPNRRVHSADVAAEAEKAAQKAAEAAAQRAAYLARYLEKGFTRKAGWKAAALAVVSEDGKFNRSLSAALAQKFAADRVQIVPNLFTPEFVSDGLFNATFNDPRKTFKSLELTNSLEALLFARQNVRYTPNPSLENVISANMELEIVALPADIDVMNQTWKFTAVGAGFKEQDARAMAEERLIKQIASDSRLSLTPVLTSTRTQ